MKIEIEIPETVIVDSAIRAWKEAFRAPEYSHKQGGDGYEAIRSEVQKHVLSIAVTEAARDAVRSAASMLMPQIVRECVTEELRKHVRRIVKEERDGNTLFSANVSRELSQPGTRSATQ